MNKQIVYPLEALSQTLNGQLLHAKNANAAVSVCIDSRTLQPGDWFICIRGERTDGHLHLEQALDKGAAGAVVQPERIPENLHDREFPQIRVPDPNLALLCLPQPCPFPPIRRRCSKINQITEPSIIYAMRCNFSIEFVGGRLYLSHSLAPH